MFEISPLIFYYLFLELQSTLRNNFNDVAVVEQKVDSTPHMHVVFISLLSAFSTFSTSFLHRAEELSLSNAALQQELKSAHSSIQLKDGQLQSISGEYENIKNAYGKLLIDNKNMAHYNARSNSPVLYVCVNYEVTRLLY